MGTMCQLECKIHASKTTNFDTMHWSMKTNQNYQKKSPTFQNAHKNYISCISNRKSILNTFGKQIPVGKVLFEWYRLATVYAQCDTDEKQQSMKQNKFDPKNGLCSKHTWKTTQTILTNCNK